MCAVHPQEAHADPDTSAVQLCSQYFPKSLAAGCFYTMSKRKNYREGFSVASDLTECEPGLGPKPHGIVNDKLFPAPNTS